jgi:peptidoglycan/LPS O-acetylase OafA/YrhL
MEKPADDRQAVVAAELSPKAQALDYMPQLDGLRCVAMSMVLVGHFHSKASGWPIPLAWLGVHLFFVLSGYLITRILLVQKQKIEAGVLASREAIKTFYIRRMLRLSPLYYTVIVLALWFNVEHGRESWAYLVFYLTNLKMAFMGSFMGKFTHLWSLAAEEQFYLLWPFLIIFLKARLLPLVLGLVIASGLAFRTATDAAGLHMLYNNLVFGVSDALGMGALLAVLSGLPASSTAKRWFFQLLPWLAVAGSVLSLWIFTTMVWTESIFAIWSTFLVSLPFAWLVWHSSQGFRGPFGQFLSAGPVIYLGKISYGIYVLHTFVPGMLLSAGVQPGRLPQGIEAFGLLSVLATITLASLSWYMLERPANQLKTKFKY